MLPTTLQEALAGHHYLRFVFCQSELSWHQYSWNSYVCSFLFWLVTSSCLGHAWHLQLLGIQRYINIIYLFKTLIGVHILYVPLMMRKLKLLCFMLATRLALDFWLVLSPSWISRHLLVLIKKLFSQYIRYY
jgi:hypothetical protein